MRAAVYCSVVVICLAGFLFTPALEAQTNTGVIVGTVSDPTGAVIPGATVTITQSEMQIATVLETNAVGNYVSTLLRAGPYEIRVEAPGFQTALRRGVVLHVNDRLQLNFTLQPGAVTTVVEVTGATPLLETQSGDVSSVIGARTIVDLPLDGRRYIDLMLLAPGVVQAEGGPGNNPREGRFSHTGREKPSSAGPPSGPRRRPELQSKKVTLPFVSTRC
ncbi:MAG: carboxypeptidase regulatory-like domain-containing protein [Acidobacteria bacterium]|nr:carboxypeptidase regulatory-like domain-containing protein [Acidobacteriota bacterium]